MRPLYITISAFGPYADRVDIDMTKLGDHGLYLVTGDTGAGKTTIFDAVCYALFNRASGDIRKTEMFRCKYARDDVVTFVELVFEYRGKKYRVHREPNQKTPKKRGEGYTDLNPTNEFIDEDSGRLIADGDKKVTNAIKEILGFDFEQYKNIAMIAQGNFQQLLTANTDSRSKILRAIFGTEKFSALQQKITTDFNELERKYDNSNLTVRNYLKDISLSEDNEYAENIASMAEVKGTADHGALLELCQKALEHERTKSKSAEADFIAADKAYGKVGAEFKSSSELAQSFARLKETEKQIEIAAAKLKSAREEYESCKKVLPLSEELAGKIAALKSKLEEYDKAENLFTQVRKASDEGKKKLTAAKGIRSDIETAKKDLEKLKKISEELKDVNAQIEKCKADIENQNRTLDEITRLGKELAETDKAKKAAEDALKEYTDKRELSTKAAKICADTENAYNDSIAGILAEQLDENSPCPVCGSVCHPNVAVKPESAPTKEQVEKAKKQRDDAGEAANKASTDYAAKKSAYESRKRSAEEKSQKYLGCADAEAALLLARTVFSEEKQKLNMLNGVMEDLQRKKSEKEKAEAKIPELEKLIEDKSAKAAAMETEAAQLEVSAKEKLETAESIKSSLEFENKGEAQNHISALLKKKNDIDNAYKKSEENYLSVKEEMSKLEGSLEELKKQTAEKEIPDLNALESKLRQAETAKKSALEIRDKIVSRLSENINTVNKLEQELKKNKSLEDKHKWLGAIARTAGGTISGSSKITLETYVQTAYFSRILSHANVRLLQMTNGQYELVRSDESQRNSKVGLDIDVIDHYSGGIRSVKSLSGGESFMASLSLALGFSDEIQQNAGGIRLDSMFVDEGFGTLDDDTLEQAIRTLNSLAEDSRLVGIISHVSELKEKLDKQIVVKKDKYRGSTVEIIS